MTKHTPGPWKMSGANTVHGPDCIIAFVGTCDEEVRKFSSERQNADAHLIAAAPELLAACEAALRSYDLAHEVECNLGPEDVCSCHVGMLRTAVAKAKGEKP